MKRKTFFLAGFLFIAIATAEGEGTNKLFKLALEYHGGDTLKNIKSFKSESDFTVVDASGQTLQTFQIQEVDDFEKSRYRGNISQNGTLLQSVILSKGGVVTMWQSGTGKTTINDAKIAEQYKKGIAFGVLGLRKGSDGYTNAQLINNKKCADKIGTGISILSKDFGVSNTYLFTANGVLTAQQPMENVVMTFEDLRGVQGIKYPYKIKAYVDNRLSNVTTVRVVSVNPKVVDEDFVLPN